MIKFNQCKLTPEILDQWVRTDVNVLLIGEKGVGKSHQILQAFERNNLKSAYFSGATLDPWIHLLGIPKAKVQEDGSEKMEFILPENLSNDVEAIFCDEWNRTNKVVRNALLELQQFKSINGRKFPNLRMVWGAVNPKSENEDDSQYDVDELDPAQLDRFHIIVELPNEPDARYFNNKFGEHKGKILVEWWNEQPADAHKILSPRRLDYVGDCYEKGLDIKFLLPVSANAKELVKKLSADPFDAKLNALLENPTDEAMQKFMSNDQLFMKYKARLRKDSLWKYWKYANKEFVIDEVKSNGSFETYVIHRVLLNDPFYRSVAVDIGKFNPKIPFIQIIKVLRDENYIPQSNSINSFINSDPNFTTQDVKFSVKKDIFSHSHANWISNPVLKCYQPNANIYTNQITTPERRKCLDLLAECWHVVPNHHHFINFMVSCIRSMQTNTLTGIKHFLPLFGAACVVAKKHLSDDELVMMVDDIRSNKQKLNVNRVEDFTSYLLSDKAVNGMSEEFVIKVRSIRNALHLQNGSATPDVIQNMKL